MFCSSPSVACTMESMRPNPSSHSFHISEAESHHSQHMHMQHLIDILGPSHHTHNNSNHDNRDLSDTELDLEQEQFESDEIVAQWILRCEPDPDLPVNDREFDEDCVKRSELADSGLLRSMSEGHNIGSLTKENDDVNNSVPSL